MPKKRLTLLGIYFIILVDISHKTDCRRGKFGKVFHSADSVMKNLMLEALRVFDFLLLQKTKK